MRKILLPLILILCMTLTGCPADSWGKAAQASNDAISGVQTIQQEEIAFYHSGQLTREEHIRLETAFEKVAKADKDLNAAILAGSRSQTPADKFNVALALVTDILNDGTLDVRDQNVRLVLRSGILGAKVLLDSIGTIARK